MAMLKFLFYVALFILIKIGDVVYVLLSALIKFPEKLFEILYKSTKKASIRIIKQTSTKSKTINSKALNTISLNKLNRKSIKLFKIVVSDTLAIVKSALLVVFYLSRLPIVVLVFVFTRRKVAKKKKVLNSGGDRFRLSFGLKIKYMFLGTIVSLVFVFLPLIFYIFISDLPRVESISVSYIPKTTRIFDRNGELLYEIYANQNRTVVGLEDIPKALQQATIAIEDKDFYKHPGFDIRGITRAFVNNLKEGELQGGSTITQQLVKSALLTPEPTLIRKSKELVLALWAERIYEKDEILELYFNYVPYGGTAWGIEAASEVYFGKEVGRLNLAESAFLAGLPRAPSLYSPFIGEKGIWKKRQEDVLFAMVRSGYINQVQAETAYDKELVFKPPSLPIKAPHFVMYVRDQLIQKYGLYEVERGGLQVTTTLDLKIQRMAERIVTDEVKKNSFLGIGNGAALITDPATGDVLAMVGSRNYFDDDYDGNVNVVTSLRQPGSSIKLVTYALALSSGFTDATIIDDSPLSIPIEGGKPYIPVNYDGVFHGKVPLRLALANSFNIPAVKVAQKLGVENIVKFGRDLGISSWQDSSRYGLSITLGAAEVTMLDLATAYGTIANGGSRSDIDPVLEIRDSEGSLIKEKEVQKYQVVDPGVAFIMSDILADNRARSRGFGYNSPLYIPDKRVSVKTGTSDNKRDNWTVGYTKDYVVAAWVGNNDNTPLSRRLASGISGAAPIWNRIMVNLLEDTEENYISVPENVISKSCLGYKAYFIKGTESSVSCRIATPTPSPQEQ